MIQIMLAIWFLVSLPFLNPDFTSGSSWFMYCQGWRMLSIALLVYEMSIIQMSSLNILWHCPSLGLEWKLIFSRPVATTEFSKFAGISSAALSQQNSSTAKAPLKLATYLRQSIPDSATKCGLTCLRLWPYSLSFRKRSWSLQYLH